MPLAMYVTEVVLAQVGLILGGIVATHTKGNHPLQWLAAAIRRIITKFEGQCRVS
jgi:hypothetical protein